MAQGPAVSRRRLGAELRRLRQAAGKTVEDAAAELECSQSKISRLENGRAIPKLRDIRDLVALYEPESEADADQLIEWAKDGQGREWVDKYRDVIQDADLVPDHLRRYVELEQHANSICNFEPDVVPGLLQSDKYIAALLQFSNPYLGQRGTLRLLDFRVHRRAALKRHEGLRFEAVLHEGALSRWLSRGAILLDQLLHLESLVADPLIDVDFRLLPRHTFVWDSVGGPFSVMQFADDIDQDLVFLEDREAATYLETQSDVQRYLERFRRIQAECMTVGESIARMKELRQLILDSPTRLTDSTKE